MLKVYSVDDIIIVRAADSPYDEWNNPNDPTLEPVSGYLEWKTKMVRNLAGEEVISRGNLLLAYDKTIDHNDKLRINSIDYPILALEPAKDFSNIGIRIFFQ